MPNGGVACSPGFGEHGLARVAYQSVVTSSMSSHHKQCRRYNVPGHAHALTFSCFHRRPFLSRDRSRRWLLKALEVARERHRFDLWSYCIMPEHVHLLLYPRSSEYLISENLRTIKQSVSVVALRFVKRSLPASLHQFEDRHPLAPWCTVFGNVAAVTIVI